MEFEQLAAVIAGVLNIEAEEIRPDSDLTEDLGADSLDVYQIMIEIEEALQVEVDAAQAEQIQRVDQILDLLKEMTA